MHIAVATERPANVHRKLPSMVVMPQELQSTAG
jgi:hypothetical protein